MSKTAETVQDETSAPTPVELMSPPTDDGKLGPEIDAALAGGGDYISVGNGKVRKILRA